MISLFHVPLQGFVFVRPPARNKMEKQEANNQIGIQTVSLLSDFLCQSKVVSWWQRGRQVSPDFLLHWNTLQPLPSDPNKFPGHMKYKTPPTSSGSSLGLDVLWRSPLGGIQIRSLGEVSQLDPWSPSKPLNCCFSTERTSVSTRSSHQISQVLLRLKLSNSFCLDQSSWSCVRVNTYD